LHHDAVTDLLSRLIAINRRSAAAYRTAAAQAEDPRCRALFNTIARQRAESVQALAKLTGDGEATVNGVRSLPSHLPDIEEEAIVAFSKALDHALPIEVRAVLEDQYRMVRRAYGRLVTLMPVAG
jgi:hypothetical protein